MMLRAFCTTAALALATSVSAQPAAAPSDYETYVRLYLRTTLKDPGSVQMELLRPPAWGDFTPTKTPWSKPETGWKVCYSINAKNSMGGYTGYQTVLFVLHSSGPVKQAFFAKDYDYPSGNRVLRECAA